MPSKSLVSSWTAPVPSPASHSPHVPHAACPGNLHLSHTRLPVLRHLHGLCKGLSFPRKRQPARDAVLRRASSTISMPPGAMLMSTMIAPPPSPPIISSPSTSSPTTPRLSPFPCGADTNRPAIIVEVDPGSRSRSSRRLSPVVVPRMRRQQGAEPSSPSSIVSSTTQPGPVSAAADHSLLTYSSGMTTSASQPATGAFRAPPVSVSVSILDAATRLQHFHAMIAEMRAALLHCDHDLEVEEGEAVFHTGNGYDDNDDERERERERILRLLEDVTRKVKRLG